MDPWQQISATFAAIYKKYKSIEENEYKNVACKMAVIFTASV